MTPGPRPLVAAVLALLAATFLTGAVPGQVPPPDDSSGVRSEAIPGTAAAMLPLVVELTAKSCPELPPVWVVAQVQAESGWDPAVTATRRNGPAGLYQFNAANWVAAGGYEWESDPPSPGTDVLSAETHLRVAIPWVCANLRAVTGHLQTTGKPTAPLDAMLVCHIAGCSRVTGSATGVPQAGEAGCAQRCAAVVARYIAAVHANVEKYSAPIPQIPPAPAAPAAASVPGSPAPWTGGGTGCDHDDPTSKGCLTGAARHGLAAAAAAFGTWPGPVIRSAGCWDKHAWNPRSDHSRGKACDLFPGRPGAFAKGDELAAGWRIADWFRVNAGPLRVKYLIWQGRYWDPSVREATGNWGKRYSGNGIYNTRDATGGHYDHVHVSFLE